jgi:60 kDa SS-A/Ro ribonucleoprotein
MATLINERKLPTIYEAFYTAQNSQPNASLVKGHNLSWEMLPTEWLNDPAVNEVLVERMPLMATVRQLGKLTANGTLKPMSELTQIVIDRMTSEDAIRGSKIHPMHYLLAAKNYAAGYGFRGSLSWNTDGRVVDALDEGFYKSFANVESTGKAFMLGIDVSGSMSWPITGSNITCAEAAGAMAVVIARTESVHFMHGFTSADRYHRSASVEGFVDLGISANDTLNSVMNKVQKNNFGGTDCAVPMLYAAANDIMVDTFVVLTDNETWAGNIKPVQALQSYRETHNPNAKLVVVGMTSTGFSIADPNDSGMLDVVGFDANILPIISEFTRG